MLERQLIGKSSGSNGGVIRGQERGSELRWPWGHDKEKKVFA
jgi:hypothetical protein